MVLIGGGTVATRKARLLLRAGANLTVVAPEISAELENTNIRLEESKNVLANLPNDMLPPTVIDNKIILQPIKLPDVPKGEEHTGH